MLAVFLLLSATTATVVSGLDCSWEAKSSGNQSWVPHGTSCYKWFERQDYWYPAEQSCKSEGGHLVSISDKQENTFVGRLTYCQRVWIGLYGVNADHLSNSSNYRWTDGTVANAKRHNFSQLSNPHQPLVSAKDLQWFNNLYHERSSYVCKGPNSPSGLTANHQTAAGCLNGWHRMGDFCYFQPGFKATYIEASFYCDGRQAQLVSVHTDRELRLLSLLDLSQESCSLDLWIGLVKLNPCRPDFSTLDPICYRWADRSGDLKKFPEWAVGHPNGDLVTNCVVLKDRNLRSEPCYARHNFVCKRQATQQPPTQPPPTKEPEEPSRGTTPLTPVPPGLVKAAYDFRRGKENLAQPGRFHVLDLGGAVLSVHGAILNGSSGILVDTESSTLTRPLKQNKAWTLFYYAKRAANEDEILIDVSDGGKGEPALSLLEQPNNADLTLYGSTGYFKDESDIHKALADRQPWIRGAVVFSAGRATFYRNSIDVSTHAPATASQKYPDNDRYLMLGNAYNSVLTGYQGALACFGIAHVALTEAELAGAFMRYCP